MATFSDLVIGTAGTYTLKATDGALTDAISGSFLISNAAGPAAKLQFIQEPTNTLSGALITPPVTVDVEDANGNLVTSDSSSTVILTIASGPPAGTASESVVDGVATLVGLYLNTVGTYTLKATDGSLTPATSTSFDISAPFATLTSGALLVEGTAGSDTIAVTTSGSTLSVTMNGVTSAPFALASITSIDVEGNAGADTITLCAGVPSASVQGGPGANTITCSDAGDDTPGGGKGHDSITCGSGADFVRGGARC